MHWRVLQGDGGIATPVICDWYSQWRADIGVLDEDGRFPGAPVSVRSFGPNVRKKKLVFVVF